MKKSRRLSVKFLSSFMTLILLASSLNLPVLATANPDELPEDSSFGQIQFANEDSTFVLSKSNIQINDEDYYPQTANIYEEEQFNQNSDEMMTLEAPPIVGDPMVFLTQRWLNQEYGSVPGFGSVVENGRTGWNVIYGLTRALQHELGITSLANSFGPATSSLYSQNLLRRQDGVTNRKFAILQGALWCKGYSPGYNLSMNSSTGIVSFNAVFDANVENAVKQLKRDAGFVNPDGVVTLNVMKALMSMDSFKLLGSSYGGKPEVRTMQQKFNRTYEAYVGLIPCDGVYGRSTNKALVYALQAEEGLPVGTATGSFGPTTKNLCPQIPYVRNSSAAKTYQGNYYTNAQISAITELMQFGLFLNGFGDGIFDGSFNPATQQAVLDFQQHYALPKIGIVNLDTWMSLLISSGNPARPAIAADCATILNQAKAKTLYDNGYRYIGRYLTGTYGGGISKALTKEEANIIFNAGLRFFPIYQTSSNSESYFTEARGTFDAQTAIAAAKALGLPAGTIIYFAVDFDAMDYQITDSVLPYFKKIHEEMSKSMYKTGIYGSRNVCSRVSKSGYSCSSFVGDMSTGFSGNLGFKIPDNWAFSQFANLEGANALGTGDGRIEIDKNAFSGRDQGVGKLNVTSKKAIYVLPGYMGSRLYTDDGKEYWANEEKLGDDITDYILFSELSGKKDTLRLDSNGENSKLHADMTKDFYGTPISGHEQGTYKNLVEKLKTECSGYDVVFFPYNWLADLNDSATSLQNHINNNNYNKVVFVTHSTGGLLASAYIAKSYANRLMVEKALLIAPPLFGTYSSLNPLETGKEKLVTDKVEEKLGDGVLNNIATFLGAYSRTYQFVRKAVHNSPTTYQLLPSVEYLKLMPQIYENEFKDGTAVTSAGEYYKVLNGSDNINSKLTNGGARSHQAFRNNLGDVVSVLQQVDTVLIGTSKGHKTLAIAKYLKTSSGKSELVGITKKADGDGTILDVSAFALSSGGKHVLKYKDYKDDERYDHFQLATKAKPIQYVCDYINGNATATAPSIQQNSSRSSESEGMSSFIKIDYSSSANISVNILDNTGATVAEISENNYFGFNGEDDRFDFTPLSFTEEKNNAVIYMPNTGYKIIFKHGNTAGANVNFNAEVSTLNADGWKDISVTKSVAQTNANGIISSVDGTINIIDNDNISGIVSGTAKNYFIDWELPNIMKLNIGNTRPITITGGDAANVSSLLSWMSADESVVTVSSRGEITAVGFGKTTISATDGNKSSTCEIVVMQNAVSVSFSDIEMVVGERKLITPTFIPINTTETDMTYTYDNAGIISIDNNGTVSALAAGTVTVTGTTDYGVSSTFVVNVIDLDFTNIKGDVNGDNMVDTKDLVRLKKHIAGNVTLTGSAFKAGDFDSDEVISAADLVVLKKMLLGVK